MLFEALYSKGILCVQGIKCESTDTLARELVHMESYSVSLNTLDRGSS